MKSPVIGIPEMGNSLFRRYMKSKYAASLRCSGARVQWLPWTEDENQIQHYVDACDGLLMPGGADIDPALYGHAREAGCGNPHPRRDAMEPTLLRAYLETGKPVLAICRGLQMLCVVCGGTLKQDISKEQQEKHADFGNRSRSSHWVTVREGSILHTIIGAGRHRVNSMHHQVIDLPGELTVSAVSDDGYTEAVELTGHPFCIGVQWHPEHMAQRDKTQQAIFDHLILACKEKAKY